MSCRRRSPAWLWDGSPPSSGGPFEIHVTWGSSAPRVFVPSPLAAAVIAGVRFLTEAHLEEGTLDVLLNLCPQSPGEREGRRGCL